MTKKPNSKRHQARQLVLQALYQWQLSNMDPQEIANQFKKQSDPNKADMIYFEQLFLGIINSAPSLDNIIQPFLDRPSESLDPVVRAVLRIGTFELAHLKDIPLKVSLNEALMLAKTFGSEDSYKFVNGVLDKIAKSFR